MKRNESSARAARPRKFAFTILELLVVIAVIMILARLFMPALSSARQRAYLVTCTNNMKQIWQAFRLYAHDDPNGRIPNEGSCNDYTPDSWLIFDSPCLAGETDPNGMNCRPPWAQIRPGTFWQKGYIRNPNIYMCPSDPKRHKTVTGCGRTGSYSNGLRNKSYAVSHKLYTNMQRETDAYNTDNNTMNPRYANLFSRVKNHSEAWMFVHEEEGNDSTFWANTGDDYLTTVHINQMVPICFVDGHVELWKNICGYRLACGNNSALCTTSSEQLGLYYRLQCNFGPIQVAYR